VGCKERLDLDRVLRLASLAGARDPQLAAAIAKVESDFCADAVGSAGECGIMQVLPSTAEQVLGRPVDCDDLKNPAIGMAAGVRYLELMLDTFGGDVARAVSAYNTGPGGAFNRSYVSKVSKALKSLFGRSIPGLDTVPGSPISISPTYIVVFVLSLVFVLFILIAFRSRPEPVYE